ALLGALLDVFAALFFFTVFPIALAVGFLAAFIDAIFFGAADAVAPPSATSAPRGLGGALSVPSQKPISRWRTFVMGDLSQLSAGRRTSAVGTRVLPSRARTA